MEVVFILSESLQLCVLFLLYHLNSGTDYNLRFENTTTLTIQVLFIPLEVGLTTAIKVQQQQTANHTSCSVQQSSDIEFPTIYLGLNS